MAVAVFDGDSATKSFGVSDNLADSAAAVSFESPDVGLVVDALVDCEVCEGNLAVLVLVGGLEAGFCGGCGAEASFPEVLLAAFVCVNCD